MFNNHAREQSDRILRLNWGLTGDPFRPLMSSWFLDLPDETPMVAPGACEICNAAVIEKCKTSVTRGGDGARCAPLSMCGK